MEPPKANDPSTVFLKIRRKLTMCKHIFALRADFNSVSHISAGECNFHAFYEICADKAACQLGSSPASTFAYLSAEPPRATAARMKLSSFFRLRPRSG